jgi:hypothetical protein
MKIFIIILSFFVILSFQAKLISIDMQINNNEIYTIQTKDDDTNFSFDENININFLPPKILELLIQTFINNNIMDNCFNSKLNEYLEFYCTRNTSNKDITNIKLNFIFDKCRKVIDISDLYSRKNNFYFFKLYSKENLINNNLRFLVSNNETEGKNESNNKTNANHSEQGLNENKGKSGIGWLGISLIILLSLIVIYVIYVGFRYYRRKKYQNPSFYYKITEEMFDDITPIE